MRFTLGGVFTLGGDDELQKLRSGHLRPQRSVSDSVSPSSAVRSRVHLRFLFKHGVPSCGLRGQESQRRRRLPADFDEALFSELCPE